MSSVVQGVILTLLGITALMTFGIFGPPAVKATIVAFNLTWIIGLLLYIWFTALTIRNRLNAA